MDNSGDARIDVYIAKSAGFAQPILRHLRALVHRGCPAVEETIKWGMPTFVHAGRILAGMAAFKAHCTFGFWHQSMTAALGRDGKKSGDAMGTLGRITRLDDLPADAAMLRYIKQAAKLNESAEPARPRPRRQAGVQLVVPVELAEALKQNPAAAATFAGFSPTKRKDYAEWIGEAKRAETRARRIETAIEWLAQGKSRNWKYENC